MGEPPDGEHICTFGAVGDIALSGPTASMMSTHGADWPFGKVLPALRRADILFGNLESVLVPGDFPRAHRNPRALVADGEVAEALGHAGFDVVNIANNHVLDAGTTGLLHTSQALVAGGLHVGGVGETQEKARQPVIVERTGLRFGFLCYAEDSNYVLSTAGPGYAYYTEEVVLEDIGRLRGDVDVVVVSVHADLEFTETPSPRRRDAFREFARAGATIVLGHHPHVAQGVERIGSSLIAYSLGNFVFHARTSAYMRAHGAATAESFILLVRVSRAGVESYDRVPVVIGQPPDERPAEAGGDDEARLRSELERLDDLVRDDDAVARNWRALALDRLQANARALARDADDPALMLRSLGRLLYVAENRAWVDEVERAARELWDVQRQEIHEYQRPSFATEIPSRRERVRGVLRKLRP